MAQKEKKELEFLLEWMTLHKVKGVDAAKILGISDRRWQHYKKKDDMMLSEVKAILASKGYGLKVTYGKNKKLREENSVNAIYYKPPQNTSENLAFLTDTLKYHYISLRNLTTKGVHLRTIVKYQRMGDIKISLICKISKILKIPVRFKIIEMEQKLVKLP